jgi:predicted nuclease of restriction endonuclease-like (RecB) superfamily
MPSQPPLLPPDAYQSFFDALKQRIRTAQVKAALAVNKELILLYWQIGREILQRQDVDGWGSKVITTLSKDLKREFPDMKGFSRTNLLYMRSFAKAWPEESFVHQLGGQIPWKHNCLLLDKIKDPDMRRWYIQKTVENGWSRNVLAMQIETDLYQRQGGAVTNFERALPKPQSDLANQMLKDPYSFEFLTISGEAIERELERGLVERMRDFLLELGTGFSFVGSQYYLNIGGEDFYLDLLFYHLELRCFVIIDLKMGDFKAEYSGKMNLYVSAVDDLLRREHDNPTIGMVLCKSKNKTIAEYALRNVGTPIAVSTHKLPDKLKDRLPTPEQMEMELESAVQAIQAQQKKSDED